AGADRRRHWFLDQKNPPGACAFRRFLDRPPLYRSRARRHADNDLGRGEAAPVVHLADEMLDHFLRHLEIGDDAIAQRTDRLNIARGAAEHQFCLLADRKHLFSAPDTTDGSFRTIPRPFTYTTVFAVPRSIAMLAD